ncbi:MAG TPA: hypothetical protein VER98_17845 [Terriglobia bacterium]|nr:hypothetical protein [Terriglobia bacterium]
MGVWLTGTLATAVVATENFFTIDRLLEAKPNPAFAADVEKLGHDAARELLRYLSSELNRLYFQYWNLAQLAVGILALWLVVQLPGADKPKWGIVWMLGIVLFLTVLITPFILSVGRSIDFLPRDPPPDGLRTFGLLHATYTVFDGIELILGILVTLWLVRGKEQI